MTARAPDDVGKARASSRRGLAADPGRPAKATAFGFERLLGQIETGLASHGSLGEQLLHVFEIWSVQPFDLVTASPAADELMTDSFGFANDIFDRSADRLADLLARLLRAAVTEPDALDPSAWARAQVLIAAARGFKSMARDTEDMRQRVRDMVGMTVAGLPV